MGSKTVAVLGLGAMGQPVVRRLLSIGYQVQCFDTAPEAGKSLVSAGADRYGSAAAAVDGAGVVLLMVATPDQLVEAVFGDEGAAAALLPGTTLIVGATVGPDTVIRVSERLAASSVDVLDAPVSGGPVRALRGDLVIMAGGSRKALAAVEVVLDSLGHAVYCGDRPGDGQRMKLVNQLLAGVHIMAAAEALAFAESLGLDSETVLDVVTRGAAASFMLSDRGRRMVDESFSAPASALRLFVKDMALVEEAARANSFVTPLASTSSRIYRAAADAGFGGDDDSGVIRLYRAGRIVG